MITVVSRHGAIIKEKSPYWTLKETKVFLERLEENGECFALGIYNPYDKTMYTPWNIDVDGWHGDEILAERSEMLKKEGFEFDKIEFYYD